MTTSDGVNKKEQELTADAWARLEKQLQASEQSPLWEQWGAQGQKLPQANQKAIEAFAEGTEPVLKQEQSYRLTQAMEHGNSEPLGRMRNVPSEEASKSRKGGSASRWIRKNVGKTVAACAAAILTVVIAIPTTNEALASWLNTFRMDNVMVVQETDLVTLMNSFIEAGETLEMSNRFGDFEQTAHGQWRQLSPEQAAAELGFTIPALQVSDSQIVDITSSGTQTFSFSLKVKEINSTMSKLGAEKLLPISVDGKKITLDTGRSTSINYQDKEEDSLKLRAMITYMEIPTIQVDPSVEVRDAYEAVISLPAMPSHLRTSLMQASRLEEGRIPMPLITQGDPDRVNIKGVDVYVEETDNRYATATWLAKGYIVTATVQNYGDTDNLQSVIAEMIQS
jgi:hypothetical protein